jgi:hypothetical protein
MLINKSNIQRWKFAYNAITQTQIRPRRDQFKWERIKLVTKTRREYVALLKKKFKNGKLSASEIETEKVCFK